MANSKSFITNISGKSLFACVNSKVNTWEGKELGYVMILALDESEQQKVKDIARKLVEDAKADPNFTMTNGAKVDKDQWMPTDYLVNRVLKKKGKDKEFTCITIKSKHQYTNKQGEAVRTYIRIFDKDAKRLNEEAEKNIFIPTLFDVNVSVSFRVYMTPMGQGISIRFRAIQLLDDIQESGSDNPFTPVQTPNVNDVDEEIPI